MSRGGEGAEEGEAIRWWLVVEAGEGHVGVHDTIVSTLQLCEHFYNKKSEVCGEEEEIEIATFGSGL